MKRLVSNQNVRPILQRIPALLGAISTVRHWPSHVTEQLCILTPELVLKRYETLSFRRKKIKLKTCGYLNFATIQSHLNFNKVQQNRVSLAETGHMCPVMLAKEMKLCQTVTKCCTLDFFGKITVAI